MKRKTTGIIGERLAADFLIKQGYEIIETDFRCKEGEVDIIAKDGNYLVFVEVRAKNNLTFGSPEESVTARKKDHLRSVARVINRPMNAFLSNGESISWR